jgi:hypothetical protein
LHDGKHATIEVQPRRMPPVADREFTLQDAQDSKGGPAAHQMLEAGQVKRGWLMCPGSSARDFLTRCKAVSNQDMSISCVPPVSVAVLLK